MVTGPAQAKKRINIELPDMIIEKLDRLTQRISFSRSELIRRLISEGLAQKEKEEMELAMKEGYVANYEFIKESSNEWDFSTGNGI